MEYEGKTEIIELVNETTGSGYFFEVSVPVADLVMDMSGYTLNHAMPAQEPGTTPDEEKAGYLLGLLSMARRAGLQSSDISVKFADIRRKRFSSGWSDPSYEPLEELILPIGNQTAMEVPEEVETDGDNGQDGYDLSADWELMEKTIEEADAEFDVPVENPDPFQDDEPDEEPVDPFAEATDPFGGQEAIAGREVVEHERVSSHAREAAGESFAEAFLTSKLDDLIEESEEQPIVEDGFSVANVYVPADASEWELCMLYSSVIPKGQVYGFALDTTDALWCAVAENAGRSPGFTEDGRSLVRDGHFVLYRYDGTKFAKVGDAIGDPGMREVAKLSGLAPDWNVSPEAIVATARTLS